MRAPPAADNPARCARPAFAGGKQPALAGGKQPALAGGKEPALAGGKEPALAGGKEPALAGNLLTKATADHRVDLVNHEGGSQIT